MSKKYIQRLSIHNQLNPKFLESTHSKDTYVNSTTPGSILPGTIVEFYLPQSDICDLSDCYVQFNMQTVNSTPATAEVYTFQIATPAAGNATAVSGTFRISIGDSVTAPIPYNATNLQILTALYNATGFIQNIQLVSDPTVAIQNLSRFQILTNTLSTANPGVLSFSINYDSLKLYLNDVPVTLVSNLLNATPNLLLFIDQSNPNGQYKWPQLDASGTSSILQEVDIELNNVPVTAIQQYSRLASIINRQRLVEYETTEASLLYGQPEQQFADIDYRQKFFLPLYGCGLLDKVIPMSLIGNAVFKIQLKLDQISNYLVYDPSIPTTPSVQFSNFRFYYTRLDLTEKTKMDYLARINGPEGFKLYFRNYLSYTSTLNGSTEQVIINPNVSRMTGVWLAMQNNAFTNNTLNQFRTSNFITLNVGQARLRCSSTFYPEDYLQSLKSNTNPKGEYGEFLIEALSAFGEFSTVRDYVGVYHSEILSQNTYTASDHSQLYWPSYTRVFPPSFVLAISTNQDVVDRWFDESSVVEVGINTVGSQNTAVELYNLQITSPCTAYAFIEFVSCAVWKDGGIFYVK